MHGGESTLVNSADMDRWLCGTFMCVCVFLLQLEMPWDSLAAQKDQVMHTSVFISET